MERRQFFGVTAVGLAAELLAHPSLPAADSAQDWRPDGVGSIARIGVLTPAFDPVPESEAWAMAPKGVSIHAARVRRQKEDARLFAEPSRVDPAVHRWAATTMPKEAEAVLIAGNGLRAVGVISALDDTLSRPVLTANQVTFWRALKGVERWPQVTQFGRLFSAAQRRDAPDEVCDGQAAQPSQVFSVFDGPSRGRGGKRMLR